MGLILVLAGVIAGTMAINQRSDLFIRANPQITPKQVKVTNISGRRFSVAWITDEPTTGFVKYGPNKSLSLVADDDRDQNTGFTNSYETHHVTLLWCTPLWQ